MLAVNWNQPEDEFSGMFWSQNIQQFWTEEEFPISTDKNGWEQLSAAERDVYKKVLGGLTLLDTKQGNEGMPLIMLHIDNLQAKSVLAFMGAMENIHAKSYSHIFTTLCSSAEIAGIFDWVDRHPLLTEKASIITGYYRALLQPAVEGRDLYMAMAASVFLESYLFYSGFFYPLYLSGQGKMTASGEIINLILRDESIHGVFVGLLAQKVFTGLPEKEQAEAQRQVTELLVRLYAVERQYTKELYANVGLTEEVDKFVRYNANKALMNLGQEPYFAAEKINPIVENGLKTDTKNHDFFSLKGNSYTRALRVTKLRDEDFIF